MEKVSHVKVLFSHTVIYGFGIILNKSVNFILLPVYTKYFSPEEIGMFTLIQSLSLFLGVIYTFGVETSFIKYFIEAGDERSKSSYYSSALVSLFLTSVLLSSLLFLYSSAIASYLKFENLESSIYLIKLSSLFLLIDTVYRFPLLLFRSKLNTRIFTYLNMLTFIVNLISNIVLIIYFKEGIEAIYYCSIISALVTLIAGFIMTKNYLTVNISIVKIKELFTYGGKFIFIGIFLILIDMSDRFFLKYFFNEGMVGIYWANYRLATVMSLVISAFRFSWTPYFLNLKENPENRKVISSVFTYFVFAGLLLFLFISLTIKQITGFKIFGFNLLDENYWSGLGIIPVILIAYLFSGIYSVLNAAPFLKNKTGSLLAISFSGFIINTALNFLLIPVYDIYGAAIATMLTYLLMSLIIFYYSQKIYYIKYEWNKIIKITFILFLVFIAGYYFINNLIINQAVSLSINIILIGLSLILLNSLKIIDIKKLSYLFKNPGG